MFKIGELSTALFEPRGARTARCRARATAVIHCTVAIAVASCAPVRTHHTREGEARRIIELAVQAIGGAEALAALRTVRRELIDHWVDTGQGQHPWTGTLEVEHLPVHLPQTVVSFIDVAGDRWFESSSFVDGPGDHATQIVAATGARGFEAIRYTDERPYFRELAPDEVSAQWARRLRRYPEALLRLAHEHPDRVRTVEGQHDVVAFTDPAGAQLLLHFDAAHRLIRSGSDRAHAVLGDTTADTLYSDHRRVGALTLPYLAIDRVAGVPTHRWQVTALTLDAEAPAGIAPPGDFVRIHEAPARPALHARGHGVFEILGPYNVMFAVFADHVLLVETPVGEPYIEDCLALIRSVAPDKPIRAIASHFHYDHVAGARTLVALGIPIASTPDGVAVIGRAVTATRARKPDRLARSPREPRLEAIEQRRVFEDASQRVEIYDVGPTPHVAQILVAYFAKTRTLHVADLLDVLTPELAIPGIDAMALIAKLKQYRLDVERIVPVHGVPITIEDLNRGLAIRARHVAGTPLDARP